MSTSRRSLVLWAAAVVCLAVLGVAVWQMPALRRLRERYVRAQLVDELQPIAFKNCTLTRYGGPNDGGYLLCANLIDGIRTAYSYGIDKEDNWGCQLSREFHVTIQQYDCFTPYRPSCDGGRSTFHDECVGSATETVDGRRFDTVANQLARNGDGGQRVIVKMDVEGAEWDALLATPDAVLDTIDQLPMELHGANEWRFLQAVRKLKRHFYVANLHFNNYACSPDAAPLPAFAYQVLWVNKRLGQPDPSAPVPAPLSVENAPDGPNRPDCQLVPAR